MKSFIQKYKHGIPLVLYMIFYLTWFIELEGRTGGHITIIHMRIDDYIPFCEWFIIPYLLWFLYISAVVLYFFFTDKKDYFRLCTFLFTGMTIFLIISTWIPNGLHLRPRFFPRDNFLTSLVAFLYRADTATNVFPSIHVFNSLAAHIAVCKSKDLSQKKGIVAGSAILSISIVFSTVFLKQHSMFDVITACFMTLILYSIIYMVDYSAVKAYLIQQRNAARKKNAAN